MKSKKTNTKKNVKIVFDKKNKDAQKQNLKKDVEKPTEVKKSTKIKTKKSIDSKKRDYIIIGILSLLIVGILIVSFLVPQEKDLNGIENGDLNITDPVTPDTNGLDDDVFVDVDTFEDRVFEFNLILLNEIKGHQKNTISQYYEELNIDTQKMEACLLENNYLLENADVENFPKVIEMIEDSTLAQELGVLSTPTLFVNGYSFSGARSYDSLVNFIDGVKSSKSLSLDYENKSFEYTSYEPKLYILYDKENDFTNKANQEFIDYLTLDDIFEGDLSDIFVELFEIEKEFVQYNSEKGIEIIQTTESFFLPVYYLVGDLSSYNFYTDELLKQYFEIIFNKEDINQGYVMDPYILKELSSQKTFDGLIRLLDYKSIFEDSYFIGDVDADVQMVLFTDYDCPFCKVFEEETLSDKFFEEYIDSGKGKISLKPIISGDSLFPILFFKCSQDQGVSLEVHKKIFDLKEVMGFQVSYQLVADKYAEEIEQFQREYQKIMEMYG